jgi:hypothetical protein
VDCWQSFSRRHIYCFDVFGFGLFYSTGLSFMSAAFLDALFGLLSAFFDFAVSLCSGGTLFRDAGFHPTPHKGLCPLTPY